MDDVWYLRRNKRVRGPFPYSMIARSVARGMFLPTDELSPDGSSWTAITSWERQFSAAGREHSNQHVEQGPRERAGSSTPAENMPSPVANNASSGPDPARLAARQHRRARYIAGLLSKRENPARQIALIVGSVAAIFAAVIVLAPRTVSDSPQCQAGARPEVNWNNCRLETKDLSRVDLRSSDLRNAKLRDTTLMGSKLNQSNLAYAEMINTNISYADLSGASLVGANLQRADLSYANLAGANLAYADLTGANMGGAELRETRFDHAIWTDGRVCGPGSVGRCAAQ